jgi:hypothetical protein
MGVDNRGVITPEQLATGDERVDAEDWPELAAQWLADGFDSQPLRRLAGTTKQDADDLAATVMREVLRSIGVAIPSESALIKRCDRALSVVQRDLDATGFGQYCFSTVATDELEQAVFPTFRAKLEGEGWDLNTDELEPLDSAVELQCSAAAAVSGTLVEICFLAWPDCAHHNGPQLEARPRQLPNDHLVSAWWYCPRGEHFVSAVGELSAASVSAASRPAQ